MKELSYTIKDSAGIHARPAGLMVKLAQSFESEISVECGGKKASGKKLFALMGLAVKHGETIKVFAEGSDEENAITALGEFIESNL